MELLTKSTDYHETIKMAKDLKGVYNKTVIFHCYWNGNLNEKHLYSILSCYYFNVFNNKHKIILWLENNTENEYNKKINKYCEIKNIKFDEVKNKIKLNNKIFLRRGDLTEIADFIRLVLLYEYGGCWFDLDCFFLRSFDPLFSNYENKICCYQWEKQNYPNNAIFISLQPKSQKLKKVIDFFDNQNTGWRTQHNCTYKSPIDILVLPCSWFDSDWIKNPNTVGHFFFKKTESEYNFENFYKGAFCFHWHNRWNHKIEENSIILRLVNIIYNNL